jgi:transcriptional regulator with GAF, ATPase, and Fis domain
MSAVSTNGPRLIGLAGPFKGQVFPLAQAEASIGRESCNDLWSADPSLSRKHCVVEGGGEAYSIRDLESRNGTFVNGRRVQQTALRHHDQIAIGDSLLLFALRDEALPAPAALIEVTETADLDAPPIILHQEDAIYLQPEKLQAVFPDTARVTRDLDALLKIATGIGKIREREALEWQLLGMIFDIMPADRAAILHFSSGSDNYDSGVAWDRQHGPGTPVRVSRTIVRRVLAERVALLVADVQADSRLRDVKTLSLSRVHSVLCVPLLVGASIDGVIYLDAQNPQERFDQNHLELMTAVASIAGLALENVQLWDDLREENRRLRSEMNLEHNLVGSSPRMRELLDLIQRVAPADSTVLIQGESGTGKELVARAIHRNSSRADQAFVAINCAALAESLLETELFGHEKGAFTGAIAQKKGKIEVADKGTLFLDEISEAPLGFQAKLLRVLQEHEFERVGGNRSIRADVRVVAATNKNLQEAVSAGRFRSDLFYRLNVVSVTTPPLRDRREDISLLAQSFLEKFSRKSNTPKKSFSAEATTILSQYDWPGNVRELENAIERAVVLGTEETVLAEDLPENIIESASSGATGGNRFHGTLRENKKQLVLQALEQANGYYVDAAKILGIHPNSLLRLIRNLGLKTSAKGAPGSQAS